MKLNYIILLFTLLGVSLSIKDLRVKTRADDYHAAFLTANLEGESLSADEIKDALLSANGEITSLDKYDVLLVALQEANTNMVNLNFQLDNFDCSIQHKKGVTKVFSFTAYVMLSVVCFKTETFEGVVEKNPNGWGTRLKGGVGKCIKPKKGEEIIFCFLNLHLDTSPTDGADRLLETIGKISKSEKVSSVKKVVIYAAGDWNLRVYPLYEKLENKAAIDSLVKDGIDILKRGNSKTEGIFVDTFKELVSAEKDSTAFTLNFPASNLESMPLTYKYHGDELDYAGILKTKPLGDMSKVELNNWGWLDRLGCLWTEEAKECRIQKLHYNSKSSLRKGDHLPLVGSFSFGQERRRKH